MLYAGLSADVRARLSRTRLRWRLRLEGCIEHAWLNVDLCQQRLQILAVVTQGALDDSALPTHPAAEGVPHFGRRCLDLLDIADVQRPFLLKCHEGANATQELVPMHAGKAATSAARKMAFESNYCGGIDLGQ
ncbi:hypothetical protein D5047_17415 [Verminephrobacter eiseniae]|nr:hypothetical protein [Verminephrobacter eiseniae]